jgi:hypothetical protein
MQNSLYFDGQILMFCLPSDILQHPDSYYATIDLVNVGFLVWNVVGSLRIEFMNNSSNTIDLTQDIDIIHQKIFTMQKRNSNSDLFEFRMLVMISSIDIVSSETVVGIDEIKDAYLIDTSLKKLSKRIQPILDENEQIEKFRSLSTKASNNNNEEEIMVLDSESISIQGAKVNK